MIAVAIVGHASGLDHVAFGLAGALAIGAYGIVWLRQRSPSRHRLGAWIGGVAVLLFASSSWMESVAERTFTGHMCQHLLVIVVAAPLLVIAEPFRSASRSMHLPAGAGGRRLLSEWRRSGPLLALAGFVAVLFTTHLTPIYDDALSNRLLHEAEHAAYLLSAVALWAAVRTTGRTGAPARIAAAFGVIAATAVLGLILMAAQDPLMPTYAAGLGADRALGDQRTAASIMWVGGMASTTPLLMVAFWRWAAAEDRIARRGEALTDAAAAVRQSGG